MIGFGEKAIAKQLNLDHAGRLWRPNTIYLMLQNSKYVGRFYFNRREWRQNPETGRRVYRWRPQDQRESQVIEGLRIVDDDTWEAAQHRLKTRQHLFSRRRSATAHLLSGLLICDRCAGRMSIVAKDYYGCRNHLESGTCSNDLRVRREAVEELVIRELAARLPEYIESLRIAASRRPPSRFEEPQTATRRRVLTQLRKQAQGVMQAILHGRWRGRALDEALNTYQRIWTQVEQLEQEQPANSNSAHIEIRYDRAAVGRLRCSAP